MSSLSRLPRRPEARTEKVEDLVGRVRRGSIRVPRFQRPLKWDSSDVANLFDSIYRGYPIGSLLFYKRPALASRVSVGPLVVEAPEIAEAWWVVDGQQRVTSLTACLARSVPIPSKPSRLDPFVLYFDVESQSFKAPPPTGKIPATWVPLPHLLDASHLSEWVFAWEHREDEALRRGLFEAGTRIREYSIPLYLIETDETEAVAEEIFYRINQTGKPLDWDTVHDALFGFAGPSPSTLQELAEELADVGMGRLATDRLLTCLFALRGKDTTRNLREHLQQDRDFLAGAVREALPVLRRVLSFLRQDAGIPHLSLLPKSILLDILTRFFALHPDPGSRSRILLARWFWRNVLGGAACHDRTLRRRGVRAVGQDEEESVQGLLGLLHREPPRPLVLPASSDPRSDVNRIFLIALATLKPRCLETGAPLDVAERLESEGKDALVKILPDGDFDFLQSLANRMILRSGAPVRRLVSSRVVGHGSDDVVLRSHAIDSLAANLLEAGDSEGFLRRRADILTKEANQLGQRMAEWTHNDRPSIEHLLTTAGAVHE